MYWIAGTLQKRGRVSPTPPPLAGAALGAGLEFPAAVPHSGRVVVTAGVGRFPAVQALGLAVTEAVRRAEEALGWAWATDLLSLAMLPLINEGYAAARLQLDDLRRVALMCVSQGIRDFKGLFFFQGSPPGGRGWRQEGFLYSWYGSKTFLTPN